MTKPRSRPDAPTYVDTPAGILSADGTHYRTTEPLLREYAGPIVDTVGLDTLVTRAGVWLRSPQTIAVLLLPVFLAVMPWWWAAAVAIVVYALWSAMAPGLALPAAARGLGVLENPVVQGLVYIAALSAFAASGQFGAVWTGVAGFVAFRLGAVRAALRPVTESIWSSLYSLPAADQTLRTLIVREALRRDVALPGMREIEDRVRAFWRREKS